MPATMLKNNVMYRQFIQCRFCELKMLYMFKTFPDTPRTYHLQSIKLLSSKFKNLHNWN
jgi:hypothetical protein